MKKLYVGNLSWSCTDEELKNLFESVGPVSSANIAKDRETGRSRGFGFVEMETEEDAQKAIEKFNESELSGRTIRVNVKQDNPNKTYNRPSYSNRDNSGNYSNRDNGGGYQDRNQGGYSRGRDNYSSRGGNSNRGYSRNRYENE